MARPMLKYILKHRVSLSTLLDERNENMRRRNACEDSYSGDALELEALQDQSTLIDNAIDALTALLKN